MIKAATDLEIYNLSFKLAMQIFHVSRDFPKAETYSLIDQLTRSSRSIVANIAEGWGKRFYVNEIKKHLGLFLGFIGGNKSLVDCRYIATEQYKELMEKYNDLGAKIYKLYVNWKTLNENKPLTSDL